MEFIQTGSNVQAKYTEPVNNELNDDGVVTPLTDLAKTSIKFQIAGQDVVVAKEVPASSPNGGGAVDETIVVPALDKKQATIDFWATATDLVGNESGKSTVITLSVDKLAPQAPS